MVLKHLYILTALTVVQCQVIVQTENGPVRGVTTEKANAFLGIPYAAPPVGDLRWRPPQKAKSWVPDIFNATALNPGCPQKTCPESYPPNMCPNKTDENCLYLNIWTPLSATKSSKLTVMVYIHGGDFLQLSGTSQLFNGEYFVHKGQVILVNVDYRLGMLGFLYTGDREDDARGNYGLQDQRLALQWVQNNIANFGGDPSKVTVFGQSAGAQSIANHLVNDQSEGLFRNAIMESSPFSIPYKTKAEGRTLAYNFAKAMGCNNGDLTCMRSKSVDVISDAQFKARFSLSSSNLLEFFEPIGPVVDGEEVPMQPIEAAVRGLFRKLPMIMGTLSEESRVFIYSIAKTPLSKMEYDATVATISPWQTIRILQQYPAPDKKDCRDTLCQLMTDYLFTCPNGNVSKEVIKYGNSDVYRYVFDHSFSYRGWGPNFTFCEDHVCHGEEIAFIFHNFIHNVTEDEERLSEAISTYFTNFAKTNDPNVGIGPEQLQWPKLTPVSQEMILFQTPEDSIISNYQKEHCDFWDSIGYNQ